MTYQETGVDIEAGHRWVRQIAPLARSTRRAEVCSNLGGFAGLFALRTRRYSQPILVSSTDGVGTKLSVAVLACEHHTIGIDLVAMCVNDVVVTGAEPLFFLDYLATGTLPPHQALDIVRGIALGCKEAGCALIGGETAQMGTFYAPGTYDLAGFAVGVVEKKALLGSEHVSPGDVLVGLSSSGLHSNGFSLVRHLLFEKLGLTVKDEMPGLAKPIGETLLTPTRIYVKTVLKALKRVRIHSIAHITGGGLTHNVPRVLPQGCAAEIQVGQWPIPPIFQTLQRLGQISDEEMYQTFNMGIGMVWVVSPNDVRPALALLKRCRESATVIGRIIKSPTPKVIYVDT